MLIWDKLGLIFDAQRDGLPAGCLSHAQSPQVLVCGEFIRVFFSSREPDVDGKVVSRIGFVDFDREFRVLAVSPAPVLERGGLGCFDEHGVFPLHPVRDGQRLLGYIGGWTRRVSVSVDGAIGLAVSEDDGASFRRLGLGPVLAPSLHEPFLVGDPFVRKFGEFYHMWYIFGTKWVEGADTGIPERVYKIGHAVSHDGVKWERPHDGRCIVEDAFGETEAQAMPTVVKVGSHYHMFFCFRQATDFRGNPGRAYRIGHAVSTDLVTWQRTGEPGIDVTPGAWDGEMMCYPHAFEWNGEVYLMYNGNQFGRGGFGVARARNVNP
jgi:hypothetical protein